MFFLQKIDIRLFEIDVAYFWSWKYLFGLMAFALMLGTISNYNKPIKVLHIMAWVGLIMSVYVVFQQFGIEQFFNLRQGVTDTQPQIGGTMGHPTVVSSFIAPLVIIGFIIKQWFKSLIMAIAVFISLSQVAIGSMVCGIIFYLLSIKKYFWIVFIILSLLAIVFSFYYADNPVKVRSFIQDNARFSRWAMIYDDVMSRSKDGTRYSITGFGPGSFEFMFHTQHNNGYRQAHNEFMEVLYNHGFMGLLLFLMIIFNIFREGFRQRKLKLLSSFVVMILCAGGTFTMHLGAHIFYILIVAGLILNNYIKEEDLV